MTYKKTGLWPPEAPCTIECWNASAEWGLWDEWWTPVCKTGLFNADGEKVSNQKREGSELDMLKQ